MFFQDPIFTTIAIVEKITYRHVKYFTHQRDEQYTILYYFAIFCLNVSWLFVAADADTEIKV